MSKKTGPRGYPAEQRDNGTIHKVLRTSYVKYSDSTSTICKDVAPARIKKMTPSAFHFRWKRSR